MKLGWMPIACCGLNDIEGLVHRVANIAPFQDRLPWRPTRKVAGQVIEDLLAREKFELTEHQADSARMPSASSEPGD